MNLEKFLDFWTQNNRLIIELTFGFIFILILFLIYRQFFSKEVSSSENLGSTANLNINTAEIEEKLQKIMESQLNFKGQLSGLEQVSAGNAGASSPANLAPVAASADLAPLQKELETLKEQLKTKDIKIEELAKAGAAAAAGAPAASGEDKTALEAKVKELEGRLQEYEIISEDIADLSFYKEENTRLQKELADLKGGAKAPEPIKAPPIAAMPAPAAPTPEPATAPVAAPAVVEATPEAAPSAPGPVDDDIMKEFAAAIEDQKKTSPEPEKQLDGDKIKESQQLMGDFENFLKKG